jgi:hypothetical protein
MKEWSAGPEMFAIGFLAVGIVALGVTRIFRRPRLAAGRQIAAGVLIFFGSRFGHAVVVLGAGPLLALGWVYRLDSTDNPPAIDPKAVIGKKNLWRPPETTRYVARTDRGHVLSLLRASSDEARDEATRRFDDGVRRAMQLKAIQTAQADSTSNCHGWVFAAGRFHLLGKDIDTILEDNGYVEVSDPKPGDVIVYREPAGSAVHSGLVRFVDGTTTLIESKWGELGRFIHAPANQIYSERWAFYRSSHHTHALRIEKDS